MVLNRERFASLLDPYLYKVYETVIEKGEDYAARIFDVQTSKLAKERVTGIGAADLPRKWEGQVYYGDISPLWDKEYVHAKYSTGLKFERELWDDAQWAEVRNRTNAVMLAVHRFRQLHAHAIFNGAFTGTVNINGETVNVKAPDGQPLCSTAHPLSPESSITQSNKGTSPLSVDSLEETRIAMMNFTDDKGQKLLIVPDLVVVPPSQERLAKEIVLSAGRPDTADRVDNVRQGAYDVLTLPLLENSKAWFLVDSQLMKQYCLWFDRRKAVPEREEDFDTECIKYKVVMRFSYGFHHWVWCYGHLPA